MRHVYKVFVHISLVALVISGVPGRVLAVEPALLLGYNGGLNNNKHNLSVNAQHGGPQAVDDANPDTNIETRLCVFCHTPHGGTPQTPLWNRKDPSRMGSFPLFDNSGAKADPLRSAQIAIDDAAIRSTTKYEQDGVNGVEYPNGATKLCLSCHDGATAIGEMANGVSISMTVATINKPNLVFDPLDGATNDLANTHPVSFVYDAAVATYVTGMKGSAYSLPTDPDVRLDSLGRMQCTTCHNPHMDTWKGGVGGYSLPFWANYSGNDTADYNNTCLECHSSSFVPGVSH